jgi:hypothetical protein
VQVVTMHSCGELSIDPGNLGADAFAGEIELVVPYTEPEVTRAVLARAPALAAGLNARVSLLAVHAMPYPSDFVCPTSAHAFLVDQLVDLAIASALPVSPQVVLARSREDGFRHALKPGSMVLVGTRRHFWRTAEERLAKMLVADGHKVVLLHIE